MDITYIAIALLIVAILLLPFILAALRKAKHEPQEHTGIFTKKEATRLIQLKYRYETTEELYR